MGRQSPLTFGFWASAFSKGDTHLAGLRGNFRPYTDTHAGEENYPIISLDPKSDFQNARVKQWQRALERPNTNRYRNKPAMRLPFSKLPLRFPWLYHPTANSWIRSSRSCGDDSIHICRVRLAISRARSVCPVSAYAAARCPTFPPSSWPGTYRLLDHTAQHRNRLHHEETWPTRMPKGSGAWHARTVPSPASTPRRGCEYNGTDKLTLRQKISGEVKLKLARIRAICGKPKWHLSFKRRVLCVVSPCTQVNLSYMNHPLLQADFRFIP